MSTSEPKLSEEQKKMVAIGASVGVGCLPCASHHFKGGRSAGIDDGLMLTAVVEAERILENARERAFADMRSKLKATEPVDAAVSDKMLAAFGAAIGANSLPNIRRCLIRGIESGLSGAQLAEAIAVTEGVQRAAASGHIKETERFLGRYGESLVPLGEAESCGNDCSCIGSEAANNVL